MYPGCPGCEAVNRGATAVNHSEACRKRMEEDMHQREDPRYERAMERMAEGVEGEKRKQSKLNPKF